MSNGRTPLIAGNWKMNGIKASAVELARAVAAHNVGRAELLVCPPAILIPPVAEALAGSNVALGAQDCHFAGSGAHTGDISAAMLADAGCAYVILGHSERRADHGETSELVKRKVEAALESGLKAIVCVGETLQERDSGKTLETIGIQLEGSLPGSVSAADTIIAYEPVWAIGTGRTPTPENVEEVHSHIRLSLKSRFGDRMARDVRILYGGSMNPGNSAELLAIDGVDGGLIGGASLKANDFLAIAQSCP